MSTFIPSLNTNLCTDVYLHFRMKKKSQLFRKHFIFDAVNLQIDQNSFLLFLISTNMYNFRK